ncbi:NUDIX hydrolase [Bordetella sp. H567]|uniref:CoA pyrophosphatase n=1 Tax=Bordetella sp. H567 TaxID=1697043 RepID=UPI00081C998E|nr:CoA pyrophosphatase [Bordetella sp. H567]AOB33811.1 NUDIX hydrolase [Bordetella sp. H567]
MPDQPPSSRPRRPIIRPAFDAAVQPWVAANEGLRAVPPEALAVDELRRVLQHPAGLPVQLPLNGDLRYPGREGPPVLAAVLIPLVMREEGVTVMLTQRTAHLHDHAGQISFPGGRIEDTDPNPIAAALRETQEETGLGAEWVEVLGTMPAYLTATGFSITPAVALVRPGFQLVPDAFEVAEIFEVPLSFITDPANHRLHRVELPDGRVRRYYSMPWGKYFIWGATAAMLRNLYHMLCDPTARDTVPE